MVKVGSKPVLAHVAIVDFEGNQIYNKYVIPAEGINAITNYVTNYSGIERKMLVGLNPTEHAFEKVQLEVSQILPNRIVVGHGLINDFMVLGFQPLPEFVWDTTEIDHFKQTTSSGMRSPRKLKNLASEFAGNIIQQTSRNKRGHSPLEDARASMNLFRVSLGYPKIAYTNMSK